MTTTIRVAHSPDSDDAFMFHALATGAIPGALQYRHVLSDIETLNREAETRPYAAHLTLARKVPAALAAECPERHADEESEW